MTTGLPRLAVLMPPADDLEPLVRRHRAGTGRHSPAAAAFRS